MKKSLLTLGIIYFSINVYSQISISAKTGIGVNSIFKLGYQPSSEFINFSPAFSYNFGIETSIGIWKSGEFVADIVFFNKRTVKKNVLGNINNFPDYVMSFKYLSIPLYIRIKATPKFYVNLGYVNNIYMDQDIASYDIAKINNYNAGILFGFEYEVLKKMKIALSAQTDIQPFSTELIGPILDGVDNYNYSIMLSVSYQLFSSEK